MVYDTHVHSNISTDSEAEPLQMIEAAKEKNLYIIFTEHYDADFIENDSDFRVSSNEYLSKYAEYRKQGALLGIEIGLTVKSRVHNEILSRTHPFDFVLGSVHMTDETDIYIDLALSQKPKLTPAEYFNYVEKMTRDAFYDSLAHIDYPHRYAEARKLDFSYHNNIDAYDQIFRNLIEQDISLEINTKRLNNANAYDDMLLIYSRYAFLGGRHVTIGSDSHTVKDIGCNFDKAFKIIDSCGLYPVYYKERKRMAY